MKLGKEKGKEGARYKKIMCSGGRGERARERGGNGQTRGKGGQGK